MAINQILTPNLENTNTFDEWKEATNQILEYLRSGEFIMGTATTPYELAFFSSSITETQTIPTELRALAIDVSIADGVTVTVDGILVVL